MRGLVRAGDGWPRRGCLAGGGSWPGNDRWIRGRNRSRGSAVRGVRGLRGGEEREEEVADVFAQEGRGVSGVRAPLRRRVTGEPATRMMSDALRRMATVRSWSRDRRSPDLPLVTERLS